MAVREVIFAGGKPASTREFGAISGVSPRRPPGGRAPLSSRGGAIRNRVPSARRRAAEPMGTGRPASLRPAPLSRLVPFRQDVRPGWLREGLTPRRASYAAAGGRNVNATHLPAGTFRYDGVPRQR